MQVVTAYHQAGCSDSSDGFKNGLCRMRRLEDRLTRLTLDLQVIIRDGHL